jgi:hypothetical protein
MLTHHEETHQICFCTLNSLQTIDRIDDTPTYDIVMISEPIVEKMMIDFNFDEERATNLFFDSDTYNKLSDKETQLYEKDWTKTYKILLNELKLKK